MIPEKPFKQWTVKNNNISVAFFLMKKLQRMFEGYQKDVRMTSTGCREKDSKKLKIYLEDVQRMSKGFPKDVLRMSKGHPEGSKGDLQRKDWGCIIMHTSA